MKDTMQSRVASILTFGVGVWVVASPLFIAVSGGALVNVLVVGGIIAIAGLVQLAWNDTSLPSWIAALAALWLFGSAFIFSVSTGFVWSAALSAAVAFVLAIWDGVEINHAQHAIHHTTV